MVFNIIGALGGAVIGGITGGPAGAVIGASGGSSLGGMIDTAFSDTPSVPGASGEQKSMLASSVRLSEQTEQMRGVTAAQVQRMYQAANLGKEQQLQTLSAMQQMSMTPFEREAVAKSLIQQVYRANTTMQDRIAEFDAQSESQRIAMQMQANQQASLQAERVQRMQQEKEMKEMQLEQAKWDRMGQLASAAVQSVGLYYQAQAAQDLRQGNVPQTSRTATPNPADVPVRVHRPDRVIPNFSDATNTISNNEGTVMKAATTDQLVNGVGTTGIFDTSWLR